MSDITWAELHGYTIPCKGCGQMTYTGNCGCFDPDEDGDPYQEWEPDTLENLGMCEADFR